MGIPTKPLKLFHCVHDGRYLFGISVVIAKSKKQAKAMLLSKLLEINIDSKDGDVECTELSITEPGVHVLFDGVY